MEHLEGHVASVEQTRPTLAPKDDLGAAIAALATKAEVRAEIKAEGEQTRRHIGLVFDGLRADVRRIAESQTAGLKSLEAMRADLRRLLEQHDSAPVHQRRLAAGQ